MVSLKFDSMKNLNGYFRNNMREEIFNACNYIEEIPRQLYYKALIRVLWASGRRVSEVIVTKVSDINLDEEQIYFNILKKKVKQKVFIPIDLFTLELLTQHIIANKLQEDDYLFPSPFDRKKHITRNGVYKIVEKLCNKAGITSVGGDKPHPHIFRHSLARDMAKNSSSVAGLIIIKQMLQHSDLKTTQVYLNFSNQEMRDLLNKSLDRK